MFLVHPARFILVGTMNPEEGELRPQLLDRFGLCVEVGGLKELEARTEVVERWLAFEADALGFAETWEAEQESLRQSIGQAQVHLPQVRHSPDIVRLISRICLDGGSTPGRRADIYLLKPRVAFRAGTRSPRRMLRRPPGWDMPTAYTTNLQ